METGNIPESFSPKEKGADLNSNCNETARHVSSSDHSKPENSFKSRTCSYFYKYGYCKFGSNCKYKHFKKSVEKRTSKNQKTPISQTAHENKQAENKDLQSSNAQTSSKEKEICKYFMLGDCKKGDNCEYIHSVDLISSQMNSFTISSESQNIARKVYSSSNRSTKKRTLCYYFKKGLCHKGDACRYYHPNKSHLINSESLCNFKTESNDDNLLLPDKTIMFVSDSSNANKNRSNYRRTFNIFDLSTLTADAVTELRTTEINQLKKRFPQFEIISENQTYCILFQPSDPDWAFDVKKLKLAVEFPEKYPTEKCIVSVIRSAENIPLILIKHLNTAIYEWIEKKFEENRTANKTELMFRSFLRWFDKSLEDLFITGLKKVKQDIKAKEAGIEFVPVENLFSSPEKACAEKYSDKDSSVIASSQQPNDQISDSKDSSFQTVQDVKPSYCSSNNGIKITFTNVELIEGAAALTCTKISVTLQCSRCRTPFNMKSAPKKSNSHNCSKCNKNVGFTFESMTVHEFSSALGTLHLLDCIAVDVNLVECYFLVDCLNCSQQVSVDGIHYGQKHKMWCTFCNQKMLISIGSVKFLAQNLTSFQAKYTTPKKSEKKFKDPVVKEGEPLPDFGACKHYKKSFRWLRFPCCGRLYACDECHNEKETGHEMKYASRMVCGFCAKEQPYSREKPCLNCSQDLTRKSGSHWEGGKGCRNKIQMSREDKQKYSGISKTVSKRAQNSKLKKKN